jgi:hypothetical protein
MKKFFLNQTEVVTQSPGDCFKASANTSIAALYRPSRNLLNKTNNKNYFCLACKIFLLECTHKDRATCLRLSTFAGFSTEQDWNNSSDS